MEELFSFPQPDETRKDNLRRMLLARHEDLYAAKKVSLWDTWSKILMVPIYAALFLSLSFGSVVGVKAYSSPAAEVMGTTYGLGARVSYALSEVTSDLSLSPAPNLPGLSVEETRTLGSASGANKIALLSKVARTLPDDKKANLISALTKDKTAQKEVSHTIHYHLTNVGIQLNWEEQPLPGGALPSAYSIEVSQNQEPFHFIARVNSSSFLDKTAQPSAAYAYRISILDWQNTTLPYTLSIDIPANTSVNASESIPTISENTSDSSKKEKTPVYDFRDATQPLLDLNLGLHSSVLSTKSFTLQWNQPSVASLGGYNIYRDNIKRNTALIHSLSFEDFDVLPGKVYQYQVRAATSNGEEIGKSEKVSMKFPDQAPVPTGLSVAMNGNVAVISWTPVKHAGFKEYLLFRKDTDSGNEVTFSPGIATTYHDSTVQADHIYLYSVQATLLEGQPSGQSKGISLSVPAQ